MATLTMDLPDEVLAALRLAPDELSREMRLAVAANWYGQGKISQEVAASLAGVDRTDFLLALARRGFESFRVDFGDLDRELARG